MLEIYGWQVCKAYLLIIAIVDHATAEVVFDVSKKVHQQGRLTERFVRVF